MFFVFLNNRFKKRLFSKTIVFFVSSKRVVRFQKRNDRFQKKNKNDTKKLSLFRSF